ncbi:hypothetical protein CE91St44_06450 [Oscillospiraceae bacterium]|nr:hypothetical protein CE91St44_06450 [Oscillospiraceae bacterium]
MKRNLIRAGLFLTMLGLAALLVYGCFVTVLPDLWPVVKSGDEAAIEEYLRSASQVKGLVCLGLLQFVQVVSVVLPGAPIQIAGGVVFGTLRSFAVCHLCFVAANAFVFWLARRLGSRLEQLLGLEEAGGGKAAEFLNSNDPGFMAALACLMPGIPNGIVPYAAARTALTLRRFAGAVYLASLAPILVMCAVGRRLLSGDYLPAAAMIAVLLAAIFLLWRYRVKVWRLEQKLRAGLRGRKRG